MLDKRDQVAQGIFVDHPRLAVEIEVALQRMDGRLQILKEAVEVQRGDSKNPDEDSILQESNSDHQFPFQMGSTYFRLDR